MPEEQKENKLEITRSLPVLVVGFVNRAVAAGS
jgi:hypothetical protein